MRLGGISFRLLIAQIKLLMIFHNVSISMSRWCKPNSTSLFHLIQSVCAKFECLMTLTEYCCSEGC